MKPHKRRHRKKTKNSAIVLCPERELWQAAQSEQLLAHISAVTGARFKHDEFGAEGQEKKQLVRKRRAGSARKNSE